MCSLGAVRSTSGTRRRNRATGRVTPKLPAPAPVASVAPTAANEPQNQQKDDGPNKGVQYESDNSHPEVNTKSRQQPITDECPNQADDQIADQSKTATFHHPACQPSGNNSDNNDDQETLIRQVHDLASQQDDRARLMPIGDNSSVPAIHSITSSFPASIDKTWMPAAAAANPLPRTRRVPDRMRDEVGLLRRVGDLVLQMAGLMIAAELA